MSSQWLFQVFRVKGYTLTKLEMEEHRVFLYVEPQEHRICCSACHSRNVRTFHQQKTPQRKSPGCM